jgi:NAD(P)-dependent dehydrogenase (short-subunit alcohol dehydrogenase family)
MARDHGRDGIRVVPVCPGDVDTSMLRGEFADRGIDVEQGLQESAANVPMRRVCTPEEVAHLVRCWFVVSGLSGPSSHSVS